MPASVPGAPLPTEPDGTRCVISSNLHIEFRATGFPQQIAMQEGDSDLTTGVRLSHHVLAYKRFDDPIGLRLCPVWRAIAGRLCDGTACLSFRASRQLIQHPPVWAVLTWINAKHALNPRSRISRRAR